MTRDFASEFERQLEEARRQGFVLGWSAASDTLADLRVRGVTAGSVATVLAAHVAELQKWAVRCLPSEGNAPAPKLGVLAVDPNDWKPKPVAGESLTDRVRRVAGELGDVLGELTVFAERERQRHQ